MTHLANYFITRRKKLISLLGGRSALFYSGSPVSRNYRANHYPFRANSHFLYYTGLTQCTHAYLLVTPEQSTLFLTPKPADDEIWHGKTLSDAETKLFCGVDEIQPIDKLSTILEKIPHLGRLPLDKISTENDLYLADCVIDQRLYQDEMAIGELKRAAQVTQKAHIAGMRNTKPQIRESDIRAAMEYPIIAENFTLAYMSIISIQGEVLHNHRYDNVCRSGDLVLADVGAETDTGWASDVTRTWPVSGRFSSSQKDIYELVLSAQKNAINKIKPGLFYRDIHFEACRTICQGLVDLGLLVGDPQNLFEKGAHAMFFPHGIGHLMGLDVHDMEDLGDKAGYARDLSRSTQFGLSYLRLNRKLEAGMCFTIEPGIYFIDSLLKSSFCMEKFKNDIVWDKLNHFSDVRGIRIEDDILLTSSGIVNFSENIPKEIKEIEPLVGSSS